MKDQLVKEFLHLNRKRRFLLKRLEKDKAQLNECENRIKEIENIMRGK